MKYTFLNVSDEYFKVNFKATMHFWKQFVAFVRQNRWRFENPDTKLYKIGRHYLKKISFF